MRQELYAAAWGLLTSAGGRYELASVPALLTKLKSLGYAGIEIPIVFIMQYDAAHGGAGAFAAQLASRSLRVITQVFSSGAPPTPGNLGVASLRGIAHRADATLAGTRDVAGHCEIWAAQVAESLALGGVLAGINSHTGKDYFSAAEADELFAFCVALEARDAAPHGVAINHETHRARVLYTPWAVPRLLAAHPALRLTADLSHFSVVTETGADDPEVCAVVAALTPAVRHLHARVGFEEGPQVPDPRGAEWAKYHEGYEVWWAAIFRATAARGDAVFTTTPEFGPKAYAWSDAHTGETYNNIWDVNHFIAARMAALWTATVGEGAATVVPDADKGVWADVHA